MSNFVYCIDSYRMLRLNYPMLLKSPPPQPYWLDPPLQTFTVFDSLKKGKWSRRSRVRFAFECHGLIGIPFRWKHCAAVKFVRMCCISECAERQAAGLQRSRWVGASVQVPRCRCAGRSFPTQEQRCQHLRRPVKIT